MADRDALVEAGSRPTMRFVEVKTPEQQGLAMIFRLRDLLVGQRTQVINALRGHLAGFGLVTGKGRENVDKLRAILEPGSAHYTAPAIFSVFEAILSQGRMASSGSGRRRCRM